MNRRDWHENKPVLPVDCGAALGLPFFPMYLSQQLRHLYVCHFSWFPFLPRLTPDIAIPGSVNSATSRRRLLYDFVSNLAPAANFSVEYEAHCMRRLRRLYFLLISCGSVQP